MSNQSLEWEYAMSNESFEPVNITWDLPLEREYTMYDYQETVERCRLISFVIDVLITGTLSIVGLIGNSLTFAVFWKGNFKTSTSFLFMCLSLSDSVVLLTALLCVSLLSLFEYTGYLGQSFWKIRYYMFTFVFPLHTAAHMTTMWVTLLIAVNRYIIVCLPLRASMWCTDRKVKIQLSVVLLFALLYASADIITSKCFVNWRIITIPALHPTLDVILPISILALLNIRLIIALRAHRRMQI